MSVSETGSELMIGAAGAEDGGEYNCSLTLGAATQSVVHTVVIRGEVNLLSVRQTYLHNKVQLDTTKLN